MTVIEKLLIQLLKIESYSGQEKKLADFVIKKLPKFKIKKQFVSKNRFNIIAKKGKSTIWLVCHLDTVKGKVPLKVFSDRIQGRGACDNKGNLAGLLMAANQLPDVNVLLTVGEEDNFIGVKKAASVISNGKFIVLEATDFKIITQQRGIITGIIETTGKESHSSLGAENSAIHYLIDRLGGLKEKNWPLFNIGLIEGGLAENIVASRASATFTIRPKTNEESKAILKSLKDAKITIKNNVSPFVSSLQKKINEFNLVSFFSEMAFFENSILFGAGKAQQMHSKDEFILKQDLNQLSERLVELVKKVGSL